MRNLLVAILACVLCSVFSAPAFAKADKQVVVLSCDLHCQGCCDKIMKSIAFERGVKDLVCDLKTKTVTVTYDANKTDVPTLLEAFEKIGKPAKVKEQVERQKAKVGSSKTDADSGASTPD